MLTRLFNRLILVALACAATSTFAWSPCNYDRDCNKGWTCATKGPNAGRCERSPGTPFSLGGNLALPRSDRDPSSVSRRTPDNQFTSMQCASDRDCPDGYACSRRNMNEHWYCRKR